MTETLELYGPWLTGVCDCGQVQGECVKGDSDRCPALDDEDDSEPPLYDEWEEEDHL